MDGKMEKFFQNATTYFSKVTDQKLYEYRNILEYVDGGYVITNKISDCSDVFFVNFGTFFVSLLNIRVCIPFLLGTK